MKPADLLLGQLHGGEDGTFRTPGAESRRAGRDRLPQQAHGLCLGIDNLLVALKHRGEIDTLRHRALDEAGHAVQHRLPRILAGHRQQALAHHAGLDVRLAQDRVDRVFQIGRLPLLHHQHRAFRGTEGRDFAGHQRIGDIQAVDRNDAPAPGVRQSDLLQRADDGVVHAALTDDADILHRAVKHFVHPMVTDEIDGGGPAPLDLVLLLHIGGGRQADAFVVETGVGNPVLAGEGAAPVVLRGKPAVHVAGANAQFQHHRGTRCLGEFETLLHHLHDRWQVGARVEQPDLRLHGEGVTALLNDGGAFTIVLPDHDHRATGHPGRGKVGERIGGNVGADRGLPGGRTANRVVDGGTQHRRGAGLGGTGLDVHPKLIQDRAGIIQHVHQMADRRTLITADIGNAGLQQRLGDGENALAFEGITVAKPQNLDFLPETAFSHDAPRNWFRDEL